MVTDRIPNQSIAQLCAGQAGLDPDLVTAIMLQESGGDAYRPRLEPQIPEARLWYPREWAEKRRITYLTECTLQRMSWGPCQILGSTARWMGFEDDIPKLCDPLTGIHWACQYLRWLSQRPGASEGEAWVIAAYNAGPGVKKTSGGMFLNQKYVDGVHGFLIKLRQGG